MVGNTLTRRVFRHPKNISAGDGDFFMMQGTTDLEFCKNVIEEKILEKTGWKEIAKKELPFLVDTGIFVRHIDNEGNQHPLVLPDDFLNGKKTLKECL